jgi:hypothetical protein
VGMHPSRCATLVFLQFVLSWTYFPPASELSAVAPESGWLLSRLFCIFPDLFSCLEGVYTLGIHSRLDGSEFHAGIGNL